MRASRLRLSLTLIVRVFGMAVASLLLAGCGASASANTAAASATPTCPPQTQVKTVTGRITTVGNGTIAVTDAKGAVTSVHISATTRLTQTTHPAAASLAVGTAVLVLTDTDVTVAKRISVLGQGAGDTGGFGFGAGRPTGTPSARANSGCFQRSGQRNGQSGNGQSGNGQGTGFQGVQGTITSVSSAHIIFDDAQGQAYSVAITSATVIEQTTQAKASDLTVGSMVTALGTSTSGGIAARSITIQG